MAADITYLRKGNLPYLQNNQNLNVRYENLYN
jgi:hypothetical protein